MDKKNKKNKKSDIVYVSLPRDLADLFYAFCKEFKFKKSEGARHIIREKLFNMNSGARFIESHRSQRSREWEITESTMSVVVTKGKSKRRLPLIPGTPAWKHHQFILNKNACFSELKTEIKSGGSLIKVQESDLSPSVSMKKNRLIDASNFVLAVN